jgi:hypothetical protein
VDRDAAAQVLPHRFHVEARVDERVLELPGADPEVDRPRDVAVDHRLAVPEPADDAPRGGEVAEEDPPPDGVPRTVEVQRQQPAPGTQHPRDLGERLPVVGDVAQRVPRGDDVDRRIRDVEVHHVADAEGDPRAPVTVAFRLGDHPRRRVDPRDPRIGEVARDPEREVAGAAGDVQHCRVLGGDGGRRLEELPLPRAVHPEGEETRELVVAGRDEVEERRHEPLLQLGVAQVRVDVEAAEGRTGRWRHPGQSIRGAAWMRPAWMRPAWTRPAWTRPSRLVVRGAAAGREKSGRGAAPLFRPRSPRTTLREPHRHPGDPT